MSLESQIAALVSAANSLTSQVAGKMAGIDQKVNAATAAVSERLRKDMNSIVYVDSSSGDDSNAGSTRDSAKKTIHAAIESTPPNSSLEVRLVGAGSQHELTKVTSLDGRKVSIWGYDAVHQVPTTYPAIKQTAWVINHENGGYIQGAGFRVGIQGFIKFVKCRIDTAYLDDPTFDAVSLRDYQTSLVGSQSSVGYLWLEYVETNINHLALTHQHTTGSLGFLDIILRSVSISKADLSSAATRQSRQFLIGNYGNESVPFSIYVTEGLSHNATSLGELISSGLDNVVSNIDFSA